MANEAQVGNAGYDGSSPPRGVARSAGELVHDLMTLAELQGRLFFADARDGAGQILMPIVIAAVGVLVFIGCIPVALVALALLFVATTTLTQLQAFGLSLLIGLVLSALLTGGGIWYLRHGSGMFHRTQAEWQQNVKWARDAMKRLTRRTAA